MGLKNKDGLYPKGCPICMCYPSSSNMCYADLLRVQVSIKRNQKFMEMKSEKKKLAQQVRNESSTIPEKLSGKRKHHEGASTKHELENDSVFNENHGPDSTNKSSKHEDSDDQMDYTNETDTAIKNKSVSSGPKLKPIISKKELIEFKSSGTLFCRRIMYNFGLTKFKVTDLHGKRRNLRIGHPGLACIHCDHVDTSAAFKHVGHRGRYFPSTIKTLSDTKKTLFTLYKHLQRCKHMDPQELEILAELRKDHEAERSLQKHGSQKQFFVTIWDRLYKDNADHIVKGDILERNKGRFVAEEVIAHEGKSSLTSVKKRGN